MVQAYGVLRKRYNKFMILVATCFAVFIAILALSYALTTFYFHRIVDQAREHALNSGWNIENVFVNFGFDQRSFQVLYLGEIELEVYVASSAWFQKQSLLKISRTISYDEIRYAVVKASGVSFVLKNQKALFSQLILLWSALKSLDESGSQVVLPTTNRATRHKIIALAQEKGIDTRTKGLNSRDIFYMIAVFMVLLVVGFLVFVISL